MWWVFAGNHKQYKGQSKVNYKMKHYKEERTVRLHVFQCPSHTVL